MKGDYSEFKNNWTAAEEAMKAYAGKNCSIGESSTLKDRLETQQLALKWAELALR